MSPEVVHEAGCDERHGSRQQCNGSAAEARRDAEVKARGDAAQTIPPATELQVWPWFASPKFGAALELIPGLSIALVWLGSRPESIKYSDFVPFHVLALLPPFGWLWRGGAGCAAGLVAWSLRIILIVSATIMWARANDHQPLRIESHDFFYHDYCCRPGWLIGMHTALALAVVISVLSAYFIGWSRVSPSDLNSGKLGK